MLVVCCKVVHSSQPIKEEEEKMSYPQATPVYEQVITVNEDSVARHLAHERAKILREDQQQREKERKQVVNDMLSNQHDLVELQKRQMKELHEIQKAQQDVEWRLQHPGAAREQDAMKRQELTLKQEEKDREAVRSRLMEKQRAENYVLTADARRDSENFWLNTIGWVLGAIGAMLVWRNPR